jgi:HAMP domain-containing protein
MLALVCILVPALYHRSMREIEESDRFLRFAARYFGLGLGFFAVGLTISVYMQGYRVFDDRVLSLAGAAIFAVLLVWLWLAVPLRRVKRILREGGDDSGTRQHRLPVVPPNAGQKGAAGRQL